MSCCGKMYGGYFEQWSRNISGVDGEENLRQILTNSSSFLEETKEKYYKYLAPMEQKTMFVKARAILKLDVMIHTLDEILHYLNGDIDPNETPDDGKRQAEENLLDGLRKLITGGIFYMSWLQGKLDGSLFRSLQRKGLVYMEEKMFRAKFKDALKKCPMIQF